MSATGLPELPENRRWLIDIPNQYDSDSAHFECRYCAIIQERRIREFEPFVLDPPRTRWHHKPITHAAVVEKEEYWVDLWSFPIGSIKDLTPENIRAAAIKAVEDKAAYDKARSYVGAYPPKELS